MKKNLLFFVIFLFSYFVFSYTGVMFGQKNIKIAKTKYLDLIFTQESEHSASILFEKGDILYEEIAEMFNLKNKFRLPVVISHSNQDFNGYFSSVPFSHIVLFDSIPEETLLAFEETFLNTFRHELTHAITYNSRSDVLFEIDKILGDIYNPALFTITLGFAEGATVSVESQGSSSGEGRLQNGLVAQILKQAKLDGCFPKYSEIQGARDYYPAGNASYIFGGAFNLWLEDTYGMQKYAEFWYRSVNLKNLTYMGCFKKVYGISIKDAWNHFYNSIDISDIETVEVPKKLKKYEYLTSSKEGYAYSDASSGKVFFNEKCLFKQNNLSSLKLSPDSKFIAVSYYDYAKANPIRRVRIYDTVHKCFFYVKEQGIHNGGFFNFEGNNYFACVKTISEYSNLVIYNVEQTKNGRIKKLTPCYEQNFDYSKQLFSLTGSENGELFYILKDGLKFFINKFDFTESKTYSYALPERTFASYLDLSEQKLSFSIMEEQKLPKLAFINIVDKSKLNIQEKEISGGIINPILRGKEVKYISGHFKGNTLCDKKLEELSFVEFNAEFVLQTDNITTQENDATNDKSEDFENNIKSFSLFKYSFTGPHGVFVPASIADTVTIEASADSLFTSSAPIGFTYFSSSPWTNPIWYITGGYSVQTESGILKIGLYECGTTTELFNVTGSAQVEFDADGYKQTFETFTASSKVPFGGVSYFTFADKFNFFEGRQKYTELSSNQSENSLETFLGIKKTYNELDSIFISNKFVAGIGNIRKASFRYKDYSGVFFSSALDFYRCSPVEDFENTYRDYKNVSFDFVAQIPFICPISLETVLFPTQSYSLASLCSIVLFTKEIQKSTNVLPLFYANRFYVSTNYLSKFSDTVESDWAFTKSYDYAENIFDGTASYYDELSLSANLSFTPNIGSLARSNFQMVLTSSLKYRFNPEPEQKDFAWSYGISLAAGSLSF